MYVKEVAASLVAHATEDKSRVVEALKNILPPDLRSRVSVEKRVFRGHHGNPIELLSVKLVGEHAEKTVRYLASMLTDTDKFMLASSLNLRLNKNSLYLRLSKQEAYLGRLRLYESDDSIKIVVTFKKSALREKNVVDILRGLGLVG